MRDLSSETLSFAGEGETCLSMGTESAFKLVRAVRTCGAISFTCETDVNTWFIFRILLRELWHPYEIVWGIMPGLFAFSCFVRFRRVLS